ncbi:MAG TPA: N-acetyltransferase [Solirubrobacterales bacterium]|nr:N-acetyltransferase [Solirubrobacterales bacterium]
MAIVRPEQPGDEAEIAAILVAAFDDAGEADLVSRLRASDAWVPELSMVVQQEERLVGYALLSRVIAGDSNALVLGPVAVLPDLRGAGTGMALVRMGLNRARQLKYDCAIAIAPPPFLAACGFRPAAGRGLTTEMEIPGDAFQVAELAPAGVTPGPVLWPDEWAG